MVDTPKDSATTSSFLWTSDDVPTYSSLSSMNLDGYTGTFESPEEALADPRSEKSAILAGEELIVRWQSAQTTTRT
jgi:hypothetical protein